MACSSSAIRYPIRPHAGKVKTQASTISFTMPQLTLESRRAAADTAADDDKIGGQFLGCGLLLAARRSRGCLGLAEGNARTGCGDGDG